MSDITTYKGSRCATCYWALYDGDWCQNPNCQRYGRSVRRYRVHMTNAEAQQAIAAQKVKESKV